MKDRDAVGRWLRVAADTPVLIWERHDDPETEYVRQYNFKLLATTDDEGCSDESEVGAISAIVFLGTRALNEGMDIIDEADAVDQEIYDAAEVLFRDPGGILEWCRLNSEVEFYDAVFIRGMWLDPEMRGHGIGGPFLCRVLDWLNPPTLFAIVLEPVADAFFREGSKRHGRPRAECNDPYCKRALTKRGQQRLVAWYEKLGFSRWKDTTFWWRDLYGYDGELKTPKRSRASGGED